MSTFLITLAVFGLAIAAMAVGVMFGGTRITGSCGGLGRLRDATGKPMCEACDDPPEECRELKRAVRERGLTLEQARAELFPET